MRRPSGTGTVSVGLRGKPRPSTARQWLGARTERARDIDGEVLMKRAPFAAAALAVVTTGAAALLLTFAPAQAAETTTTTATTQVAAGVSDVIADDPTLTAKPVTNLKADGAKIEVDGANFPTEDVYVAVCASTPDPTDLSKCLGAPITADGTNAAWAHIKAADLGNGSFKVML